MRELMRTNDVALVSAVEALLTDAGVPCQVLDENISALEGSIGAFPRRIVVADEYEPEARELLTDAGFGHHLRPLR